MLQRLLLLQTFSFALTAQENSEIDRIAHEQRYSGALLVAREGQILHSQGYGYAVREWTVSVMPETRFEIGSITKTFTALAILQLVEQGKCKLDDRITAYYPSSPEAWKDITIEHLLRHRSGIPPHQELTDYKKTITQPYSPAELVAEFHQAPLAFRPGSRFQYSNPGYHLLGLVVERASGEQYGDYVRKHILEPAGMKNTRIDRYSDVVPYRAQGYQQAGTQLERAPYWDRSIAFATGNFLSTTEDLLRYEQALSGGKLLGEPQLRTMYHPVEGTMGLGWFVRSSKAGVRYYEHTGSNPGFSSLIRRYPESSVVIVILSNLEETDTSKLAEAIERIVLH